MEPLAKGTFPRRSLPCPELAFIQHNCRIRCVDASRMSLPCRALLMGKIPPPRILAVGFVCSLVSCAPSPFPIDRAQSWSSTHHPGWKICLSPVPLPTLLGALNVP